jgi:hypothetical protein
VQLSLLEEARRRDPTCSDDQHIAVIAAETIAECDQRPPVKLEVVASYRDITEIRVESLPVAASLTPEPKGLVMRLSATDSERRRRFSGFHEVGHTFQPGYREQRLFRCANPSPAPRTTNDPEALSDVAAAELLLPSEHFGRDTSEANFSFETVLALADLYKASVQATTYRFADFWPEPTMVVVLEMGRRKDEDDDSPQKLRVVTAWSPSGHWPFIPRNKSAQAGGALERAYAGEIVDERASLAELEREDRGPVWLSARAFQYRRGVGVRRRVMALYRQLTGDA